MELLRCKYCILTCVLQATSTGYLQCTCFIVSCKKPTCCPQNARKGTCALFVGRIIKCYQGLYHKSRRYGGLILPLKDLFIRFSETFFRKTKRKEFRV